MALAELWQARANQGLSPTERGVSRLRHAASMPRRTQVEEKGLLPWRPGERGKTFLPPSFCCRNRNEKEEEAKKGRKTLVLFLLAQGLLCCRPPSPVRGRLAPVHLLRYRSLRRVDMGVGSRNYTIYYSILAVAYAIQAGLTLIVIVGPLKHCKDICPLSYTLRRAEYIKHNWVSSLDHSIPHKEPNRTGSCINGKDDLGVACNYYPLSERQAYQTGAVFMTNEDSGKAQFNKGRRLRRYDLLSCGAAKPQSQWVYPGSGDIKVVDTLRDDESKVGKLRQLRGVYGPQVSGFPAFLTPDEINARNPELKVKQYMPAGIVADRARFGNVSYQEARYNVETKLWPIARMLSPAGGSFQTAKDIWDYAVWTEDASEDVNKYNEGRDDKQQYKPFPLWGGYTMEEFLGVPSKAGEYEQLQESSNLPKLRAMGENSFLWTALRKDRNFCLQCRNDNSSQLWEPCDDFDDCRNGFMDGFRVSDFPLDLSLRARPFMAPFFIAALGLFTVELAGAIVCAIGLSYFAKYVPSRNRRHGQRLQLDKRVCVRERERERERKGGTEGGRESHRGPSSRATIVRTPF